VLELPVLGLGAELPAVGVNGMRAGLFYVDDPVGAADALIAALRFQGYRSEASVQRFGTVVVEGSRTVCDPHGRWAYSEPHAPAVFVSYMRSPDAARLN